MGTFDVRSYDDLRAAPLAVLNAIADVPDARCETGLPEQIRRTTTVERLGHDYPPPGRERRASVSVGESRRDNRLLAGGTPRDAFCEARHARDAALPAPNLLYPSLQVNIRGGRLPAAADNGRRYLLAPLHIHAPGDGL